MNAKSKQGNSGAGRGTYDLEAGKTARLNIPVSERHGKKIRSAAKAQKITVAEWVRSLIRRELGETS